MTDGVQIQFVRGLNEMALAFKKLPRTLAGKHLAHAVLPAAQLIRDDARIRAPYYHGKVQEGHPPPGTLHRALIVKRATEPGVEVTTLQVTYIVTVRHGRKEQSVGKKHQNLDAYYWWWVEKGTAKMRATPYLRPTFEADKAECLELIKAGLAEGVRQAADECHWWIPT